MARSDDGQSSGNATLSNETPKPDLPATTVRKRAGVMPEPRGPRVELTKRAILNAAASEFANKAYAEVSLATVTTAAGVTKGTLYAHFPSKRDLALAVIGMQQEIMRDAAKKVLARQLSGLETLIDMSFSTAEVEFSSEIVKAGVALLDSMERAERMHHDSLQMWSVLCIPLFEQAIADGDLVTEYKPTELSHTLLSMYIGARQFVAQNDHLQFVTDVARGWKMILPGIVPANKLSFFMRFIDRRLGMVISKLPTIRVASASENS